MIDVLDIRFAARFFTDAPLEKLCSGAVWSEGPVWLAGEQALLWSDIPNNRMLRWSEEDRMSVWREEVEFTNGHTLDANGDLLHCSHGLRAIMRTPLRNGRLLAATPDEVVVDRYQGKRLNSPNDLIVKRDGTIWFSDPPYGILSNREGHQAEREQVANHVFCYDPAARELHAASSEVQEPNGLAFSPDEQLLYVSDTSAAITGQGHHHITVFDVLPGNQLANPRVFAVIHPGLPDGFRVDGWGWLYISSADSVQIYHPDGSPLARIPMPEKVGNLCFGGGALYIAASTSLYRMTLKEKR
jgi:gluconolactonase